MLDYKSKQISYLKIMNPFLFVINVMLNENLFAMKNYIFNIFVLNKLY